MDNSVNFTVEKAVFHIDCPFGSFLFYRNGEDNSFLHGARD